MSTATLNSSDVAFVLRTSRLKDWAMLTLWPDTTRCFVVEEVGDFVSAHEVTDDYVNDFDNDLAMCSNTPRVEQRSVLPTNVSPQLQVN